MHYPATNKKVYIRPLLAVAVMFLAVYCGTGTVVNAPTDNFAVSGDAALKERAAAKGLFYGAATSTGILDADPLFAAVFVKECNMLVPETELKWATVRPSPTTFDFSAPDRLLAFSQSNGMRFRGHALVWHQSLPDWFASYATAANADLLLREHVTTVVGHYAGKVHSWDVVNEAIAPQEGHPEGLRVSSPWYQLLGAQYIETAFRAAAAADPSAILVYNEAGIESDAPGADVKRSVVLNLFRSLKLKGVPIHALGIQAHLSAGQPFSSTKFQNFIQQVAALGLKIMITELDVSEESLSPDTVERDRAIAGVYSDFLATALQNPAVVGVLTWGLSDKYTWINGHAPRIDNLPSRPLPLDENMARKLAWNATARAFDNVLLR